MLSWIGIVLILTMLPGWVPAGRIYTGTDVNGNVHISERPPSDPSLIRKTIPYAFPSETRSSSVTIPQPTATLNHSVDRRQQSFDRLRVRKHQLETIIAQNQASIAEAQKGVQTLRRRSGSYDRRNVKTIERQLIGLHHKLEIYQSDMAYVKAYIAELERDLKRPKGEKNRPSERSDENRPVSAP